MAPFLRRQVENRAFELCLNDLVLFACLALLFHLADAEDNLKSLSQSQLHFLTQDSIVLVVVRTTLRVAEDAVFSTRRFHHLSAYLARVGALLVVSAVLGSHLDGAVFEQFSHRCQVDIRCADHHSTFRVFYRIFEFCSQRYAFLQVLVHFPVTCYHFCSHVV